MTRCHFEDYLDFDGSELVRVVEASSEKHNFCMDVYKEYSNGKCISRNLYFRNMCGWVVAIPGTKFSSSGYYGYDSRISEVEDWEECATNNLCSFCVTINDYERLSRWTPKFYNYVVKKWNTKVTSISIKKLVTAYSLWKKYPAIEMLLALGFENVAFNLKFYKLTETKRKQVQKWIYNHQDCKGYTLGQVLERCKYEITDEDYKDLCLFRSKTSSNTNYEVFKYLQKIGMDNSNGLSLFHDYNILLKATDHNKKDVYWKYPKDLSRKHDLLLQEVENIEKAKQKIIREKAETVYFEIIKNWLHNNCNIDGFDVYIPESLDQWELQADALHQCIMRCKYYEKLQKGKFYFLVFICKDNKPIATAEILNKELKIGQFYTNELDRKNCLPNEEVKTVLNKWLQRFSFEEVA